MQSNVREIGRTDRRIPEPREFSPRWAHDDQRVRSAAGYLKQPTPLRRFWQLLRELPLNLFLYVFRAAPYPVKPGLLIMGNPDRRSPVLVTTNYELTVRRVARALVNVD